MPCLGSIHLSALFPAGYIKLLLKKMYLNTEKRAFTEFIYHIHALTCLCSSTDIMIVVFCCSLLCAECILLARCCICQRARHLHNVLSLSSYIYKCLQQNAGKMLSTVMKPFSKSPSCFPQCYTHRPWLMNGGVTVKILLESEHL